MFLRVASFSFKNLINVKLSCKFFNEVANERYIYQKVTLVDFPIVSWHSYVENMGIQKPYTEKAC
ncbi:hypothetical protein H5410_039563 [Solanum commersonii]|uniref:F-box domain-containing protein n=1 Tax=Solanum commersonii TaxID=4109 RepID=A0A9J5XLB4_SOLCO|nr:hypothetical protein H5410_039563 [Solanum commersonii]